MNFRKMKLFSCLGFLAAFCLSSVASEAVLVSVKTTGMAQTGIAYPQDATAGAFNPAGMIDVGDRFDIGLSLVHYNGKARISGNRAPIPNVNGTFDGYHKTWGRYVVTPDGGINKEFCVCDIPMSVGLIGYNRNFTKTTYKNNFPLLGTSPLGLEYVHETLSLVWATKFCEIHNFGLSLNFQIQRLKIDGIQNFDHPPSPLLGPGSVSPGFVTNKKYDYSTGWGVTLGYRCQILPCLSVGVTYQPETSMRHFKKYRGFLAHHGKFNIPRKIGAGIAWRFLPCASVAFDVEHIHWKPIKAVSNNLLHNGVVNPLGGPHGPGFGFRDQLYYRIGADWDVCECWTVRAGFRHVRSLVRPSQTTVNILSLDTIENVITLGATWCMNECSEISFFYAHGFEHKVKGHNSIPLSFGGGEADVRQHLDAAGISWGYAY